MKHLEPADVTYTIPTDLLEHGRWNALEGSRQLAARILGPEPILDAMIITNARLSDSFVQPVLQVTWKRRFPLTR